jgi:hypothetical protein
MDQGTLKSIIESFARSPIGLINFAILVGSVCFFFFSYKEQFDNAVRDTADIKQSVSTIAKKTDDRDGALDLRLAAYDKTLGDINVQMAKLKTSLYWLMRSSTPPAHQPVPPPMPADKALDNQGE